MNELHIRDSVNFNSQHLLTLVLGGAGVILIMPSRKYHKITCIGAHHRVYCTESVCGQDMDGERKMSWSLRDLYYILYFAYGKVYMQSIHTDGFCLVLGRLSSGIDNNAKKYEGKVKIYSKQKNIFA